MSLTKEDLEAIRVIVREEVDKQLEKKLNAKLPVIEAMVDAKLNAALRPIREEINDVKEESASLRKMFTTVINVQVEILDKIEVLEGQIKLIMLHLNLSPDTTKHRSTLKTTLH